jgi:hypothetical protein
MSKPSAVATRPGPSLTPMLASTDDTIPSYPVSPRLARSRVSRSQSWSRGPGCCRCRPDLAESDRLDANQPHGGRWGRSGKSEPWNRSAKVRSTRLLQFGAPLRLARTNDRCSVAPTYARTTVIVHPRHSSSPKFLKIAEITPRERHSPTFPKSVGLRPASVKRSVTWAAYCWYGR